jgi:hypothetical protein
MNEFVVQVADVFMPGLVWTVVVDTLTVAKTKRSTFSTALRAFGFGLGAYFVYFLAYYLWHRWHDHAWPVLLDGIKSTGVENLRLLRPIDVFRTTAIAPLLAIFWSLAANRKWFLRIMQKIRVTRRFGDESVWDFTFNLNTPAVEYVNLRDFENHVIYSGFVRAFSDGSETREILLEQVQVYELESGKSLYEMPLIYLSRRREPLHLEFPYRVSAAAAAAAIEQKPSTGQSPQNEEHP